MTRTAEDSDLKLRRMVADDLQTVIRIDGEHGAGPRRGYFQTRLAAARRDPEHYLQFVVENSDGMVGFVLANMHQGEYGQAAPSLAMEVIGVDPAASAHGVGNMLMDALEDEMQTRGIKELQTEVNWTLHGLLAFLQKRGFEIAPRQVISAPVNQDLAQPREDY
jgi:ribosomal protein S18 acetylase RimI-like enzyme